MGVPSIAFLSLVLPEILFCANMSKLFPIFFEQAIVFFLDLNTLRISFKFVKRRV